MTAIRVVVVDDHQMVRSSLCAMLQQEGVSVVGEAGDGHAALQLAETLQPDVVLMDTNMPVLGGIEATRRIQDSRPASRVLALSMHADRDTVAEMLSAGASGYVLKSDSVDELLRAIEVVAGGGHYVSPELSGFLVESFMDNRGRRQQPGCAPRLTQREREVLRYVAEGHTAKDIAAILELSHRTVESHRRRIMDKLGIHTVAGLTKWAIRNRLTDLES